MNAFDLVSYIFAFGVACVALVVLATLSRPNR